MKVKELIERLSQYNPEAEIGYEHMNITYSYQENDNYVEIGGNGNDHIFKELIQEKQ